MVSDSHELVPVLMSTRSEDREKDGTATTSTLTVTDRRFGPVPEDEFASERVLEGAPVRYITGDCRYRKPEFMLSG